MAIDLDGKNAFIELAQEWKYFKVSIKESNFLTEVERPEIVLVRKMMLERVFSPLLQAAKSAFVYDCQCLGGEYSNTERVRLNELLNKKGALYEINLSHKNVVYDFPNFWNDSLCDDQTGKHYSRGVLLFFMDDALLNFPELFSNFSWAYVVSNQPSILGRRLFNRAKKWVTANPTDTILALYGGGNLVIIPGETILLERVKQAVENVQWQ